MVFSTKNREPFLHKELRPQVFDHIQQNCRDKEIFLDCINGYHEHVHCLISLGKDQSISKVVQLVKGESSYWINKNKLLKTKFEWQDDYFTLSISHSQVDTVRTYIKNQEEHHAKKTYLQEVDEFMNRYGFELIQG